MTTTGYADLGDLQLYYESRGEGEVPVIFTHGGFGMTTMFGELLDRLAGSRRVIAVELQGHGHTADVDRPFSWPDFGDDLGQLITELGAEQADLVGYSLGGGVSLRAAIQHPAKVRRLVLISTPFRRTGWYPESLAGMDQISSAGFEQMKQAPMYGEWAAVAPDSDSFPALMDKTGELLRTDYDWTDDIASIEASVELIIGDADAIPPTHTAEFFALLGGGQKDAGWMMPDLGPARLAVLPGATHYDVLTHPLLPALLTDFLAE